MTTIHFKTTPAIFSFEKSGVMPNMVMTRDSYYEHLKNPDNLFRAPECEPSPTHIIIENSETHETFEREIQNITFWEGIVVIGWKDPELFTLEEAGDALEQAGWERPR